MSEEKIYPSMVIRSQAEVIELLEQENQQLKDIQDKIMEIIDLNQYNYGYEIKDEITKEILDKVNSEHNSENV